MLETMREVLAWSITIGLGLWLLTMLEALAVRRGWIDAGFFQQSRTAIVTVMVPLFLRIVRGVASPLLRPFSKLGAAMQRVRGR